METIVQQILSNFTKKFLKRLGNGELSDLDGMTAILLEDCKEMSRSLLEAALEQMNLSLRQNKEIRKEHGLVMQQHDRSRTLLTMVGNVHYARDSYKVKGNGEYIYPIDEMITVKPYQRIGDHVAAALVNESAAVSYRKAAEIAAGGLVSRQTVKNKLLAVGLLEKEAPAVKNDASEVHIFVDEDHVHLTPKKSKMVPYAVLTEGIEAENQHRNRTINPTHFADRDLDGKELWNSIAGYLHMAYPQDCKVFVHGDGANWIKGVTDIIPRCELVLDEFHLQKYLRKLMNMCPGISIRKRIMDAIADNDQEQIEEIFGKTVADMEFKKSEKALDIKEYILNNWGGIQNRYKEDMPGSCTEGQISHGLSERLSRTPAGWSIKGVGSMAMLRAYVNNGMAVKAEDFRRSDEEKEESLLKGYAERIYKDAVDGAYDWSIFEQESYTMDIASGTQQLIGMYGKRQWSVS